MSEVYEYRRAPGKGVIWLALIGLVVLVVAIVRYEVENLLLFTGILAAVTVTWFFMRKPPSGIRIDADYLVLSAWRHPRPISLDDIAHLRVSDVRFETEVWIVYRNGDEEAIFSGDLPDIDTLIAVMAERGIPVRDVT
ncbi:hypothetical protein MWU60_07970 [Yoonia sp. F2084L]|uniref:hypothetical protein n=1 Tax=Yoonia sp. F2084L TaxID=2926419 RepID=UPI001FF445B9|nr:hypothetical protein [Yoonia sp. F2084L]MCK0095505.1 hypothetical protein [Yoonia sp. F2084L]